MDSALRHWLFHMECPRTRHELALETSRMMHDRFFWGAIAAIGLAVLFVVLIAFGLTGEAPITPTPYSPPMWPYGM